VDEALLAKLSAEVAVAGAATLPLAAMFVSSPIERRSPMRMNARKPYCWTPLRD
jgi:hypothetical protein